MNPEDDPANQLYELDRVERAIRDLLTAPENAAQLQEALAVIENSRKNLLEKLIPENVFINMRESFSTVAFTVPNLQIDIPENPYLTPASNGIVIALQNNGKYERTWRGTNGLGVRDWNLKTQIESVDVSGQHYKGSEILQNRTQLLQDFFLHMFGNEETTDQFTASNIEAGLDKGAFLYRAITKSDLRELNRDGTICYSHLDPSANFETESMYTDPLSQVKLYNAKTDQGYEGIIMRWPIEHPLLYRVTGTGAFRVVPFFPHYLPNGIELSSDNGETFTPFNQEDHNE